MGYRILEYKEIWHYPGGGGKIFKEFILNIVKRKIEYSGFPQIVFLINQKQITLLI